jgi:hypothetical protein
VALDFTILLAEICEMFGLDHSMPWILFRKTLTPFPHWARC